jgi:thiol-disulfide isomerase/thioredoxin
MIMRVKYLLPLLAAAALYCAISCSSSNEESTPKSDQTSNATQATSQATAPPIAFNAVDLKGATHASSEWLGKKPVVLNFWGTWCPPCRAEMPELVKLYAEYEPKGVEMIGFAVRDQVFSVEQYANTNNLRWVMLMANENVLNDYNVVNGIPTTIFLNKNGQEITRFIGARGYDNFKPAFEAILK